MTRLRMHACVLVALVAWPSFALAQDQADLAQASQNPIAAMISLPFQNDTLFGIGPDDDTANVLNIQPVIPISLGPVNRSNRFRGQQAGFDVNAASGHPPGIAVCRGAEDPSSACIGLKRAQVDRVLERPTRASRSGRALRKRRAAG